MRYLNIVVWSLLFPAAVLAQAPLTPRPLDPIAVETLARAVAGSAVVRGLVERLESSNVIVHIVTSTQMPAGIGGTTRFVTSRGGYRYLRITIGADLTPRMRSAILGHELQHACEVADSSADDAVSMRELFEQAGDRAGSYFETRAALQTERTVRLELLGGRALQAQPVTKFDH
ncbi:MAG: hypothetical protein ABI039_11230 [Vicinamibacterales bacterium]